LRLQLRITRNDDWDEFPKNPHFRVAVVDFDKAKGYPLNFVCVLPKRLNSHETKASFFEKRFGDKSLEVAKQLLTDALKSEEDEDVRGEIEQRLKLLAPQTARRNTCASCGKLLTGSKKKWKKLFCEGCVKKKFGIGN
jgi:hypothetical protein